VLYGEQITTPGIGKTLATPATARVGAPMIRERTLVRERAFRTGQHDVWVSRVDCQRGVSVNGGRTAHRWVYLDVESPLRLRNRDGRSCACGSPARRQQQSR